MEGLSKKPRPLVMRGICRRGHDGIEDGVVNSNGEVMSQSERIRYKWDEINWRKLGRSIFKLQKRIYQASRNNDLKKVHSLQKLLLKSTGAKLLAVKRVTQSNAGKKTAGIDGVKSLSSSKKLKLIENMKLDEKCKPVRRIWIPKPGKTEKRPLGIPTMTDRARQALVKLALEPEWEAKFEPNSYGFRPARSCQDAMQAVHSAINKKMAYVLDADIQGCFDNINHEVLLKKLDTFPRLRKVIKGWLKAGVMDDEVFHRTRAGTPQGGVISPLLANIALHGLEYETKKTLLSELFKYRKSKLGKGHTENAQNSLNIIRYADDFVIIHENPEIILKAKKFVEEWLKLIGLTLSESKTRITHTLKSIDEGKKGFDFLGFWVRQYPTKCSKRGYKTLIKPSLEGQKRHAGIIRERLYKSAVATQEEVIKQLNPVIVGWVNYYKSSVAKEIFSKIDHYMFQRLWKWARKRHPNKGAGWTKRKYFRKYRNNKWRFRTENGKMLRLHSETPIKRHVKVQGTRSPYDGDIEYWKNRSRRISKSNDKKRCA
jgi:RNA-directed DNA polymerase